VSSVEELGTAAECLTGARQALRRVLEGYAEVDESLCRAVVAVDSHLKDQHAKLASLIDWRREVER
jgi:hypothetical protein